MIDFLLGVPGKLKTIADYLTTYLSSTRAAKIDNLDAIITSRAAASTAVSNADLTPTRAGYLDKLNVDPTRDPPGFLGSGATSGLNEVNGTNMPTNIQSAVCGERYLGSTSGVLTTLINLSGSGVLNFVAFGGSNYYTSLECVAIYIDGVKIFTNINLTLGARVAVGTMTRDTTLSDLPICGLDQIPFKSSLRIDFRSINAVHFIVYKYRRNT
jgi:hypothetical protein